MQLIIAALFFFRTDRISFHQLIPVNMYKYNVKKGYQNPLTMSAAPVEKIHEPLKKRR